jgi:hypothetical protein
MNTHTKIRVEDSEYGDNKQVVVFHTQVPDQVMVFVLELIKQHAMVAAEPDGEDSAGRSRVRLQTPNELVTRAFEISELAFAVARNRGHLVDAPDLNDLNKDRDERLAEEHRKRAETRKAQSA